MYAVTKEAVKKEDWRIVQVLGHLGSLHATAIDVLRSKIECTDEANRMRQASPDLYSIAEPTREKSIRRIEGVLKAMYGETLKKWLGLIYELLPLFIETSDILRRYDAGELSEEAFVAVLMDLNKKPI